MKNDAHYKSLLMIVVRDISTYSDKELARILTGLALKIDSETAIITTQLHQMKEAQNAAG